MFSLSKNKRNTVCEQSDKIIQDKCKQVRRRYISSIGQHLSINAPWLQRHIAQCPRCQKRLASVGRVNLALSFMRSQSHNLDLLMRANAQTIGVLKHSLRETPKAQELKTLLPEPKLTEKLMRYFQPSTNLAACILILFLMKFGMFSSMDKFQTQGKKAYKQYFVSRVGEDLAEDIFPSDKV